MKDNNFSNEYKFSKINFLYIFILGVLITVDTITTGIYFKAKGYGVEFNPIVKMLLPYLNIYQQGVLRVLCIVGIYFISKKFDIIKDAKTINKILFLGILVQLLIVCSNIIQIIIYL